MKPAISRRERKGGREEEAKVDERCEKRDGSL